MEGFKAALYRKLEIFRAAVGKPALPVNDPFIVSIISDAPFPVNGRPVVSINDIEAVVDLMLDHAEPMTQALGAGPTAP